MQSQPIPAAERTTEASRRFIETYYATLNRTRSLLSDFYHPDAAIVWNGSPLNGGEAFADFFQSMPTCHYDVQSFDAQPVGTEVGASILLSVSGSVKYGESKFPRTFSDTIVLKPSEGAPAGWKVAVQTFRLVSQ